MAAVEGKAPTAETVIAAPEGGKKPKSIPAEKPARKGQRGWLWAVVGVVAIGLIVIGAMAVLPGIISPSAKATIPPTLLVKKQDTPKPVPATALPVFTTQDCPKPEVFCVGLVTDMGTVDDKSFNQSAWEGVKIAKDKGLVQITQVIETKNIGDYDHNISVFADSGYDAIVTVGWGMTQVTQDAALKYPDILFIGVDQMPTNPGRQTWQG